MYKSVCFLSRGISMAYILESIGEWVVAHLLKHCLFFQVPDEVSMQADPESVYEYMYSDGVRNWGRKVAYVAWLTEALGPIKGFLTLCKINQKRLR